MWLAIANAAPLNCCCCGAAALEVQAAYGVTPAAPLFVTFADRSPFSSGIEETLSTHGVQGSWS